MKEDLSEQELDQMTASLARYFRVQKDELLIFLESPRQSWSTITKTSNARISHVDTAAV